MRAAAFVGILDMPAWWLGWLGLLMTLQDQHKLQLCSPGVLARVYKRNVFSSFIFFGVLASAAGSPELDPAAAFQRMLKPFLKRAAIWGSSAGRTCGRGRKIGRGSQITLFFFFYLERNRKQQPLVANGCIRGLITAVGIRAKVCTQKNRGSATCKEPLSLDAAQAWHTTR